MNGANECAVEAFIDSKIGFNDIHRLIRKVLDRHSVQKEPTIDTILAADRWARNEIEKNVKEMRN
jgi:1-deoxy-D-xylulose-5-phosphate reductoisomerase